MPPLENVRFYRFLFRSLIGNYWVEIVADSDEVVVRHSEGSAMVVYSLDKAFYLKNSNDVVAAKYFLKFFDEAVAEERKRLGKKLHQAKLGWTQRLSLKIWNKLERLSRFIYSKKK